MSEPITTQVSAILPMFHAESWWHLDGRQVAVAPLDRTTSDFAHLIGELVVIDAKLYLCKRVERFAHCAPWGRGELVGLCVEEVS